MFRNGLLPNFFQKNEKRPLHLTSGTLYYIYEVRRSEPYET